MKIFVTLIGSSGKVGKNILELVKNSNDIEMLSVNSKNIDNLDDFIKKSDAAIDFSTPSILKKILDTCIKYKKALILGTTGYTNDDLDLIKEASKDIPIFQSYNFSIGAYILKNIASYVTKNFNLSDIDILEKHHKLKKDSPSGTALSLKNEIEKNYNNPINIHSIRAGNIIGEHLVSFTDEDEKIEISHTAYTKKTFAQGSLKALRFVYNKKPSLYTMKDLCGDNYEKN